MNILIPDEKGMIEAVNAIANDRVVAYPTETVYGLAVNPFSEAALNALFAVKERDEGKPVLLIVNDFIHAETVVAHLSDAARACMEKFWPGPVSLVMPGHLNLPGRVTDDGGRVCVRCPDNDIARELCQRWGGPLTSTSANLSGSPPARIARDAALPGVTLTLDGGVLNDNAPSTIYDPDRDVVLREGPISHECLREAARAIT